MQQRLKILILEDNATDADFTIRALTKSDLNFDYIWVETEKDFTDALFQFHPDIILSDHSLPSFTSKDALRLCSEICPSCVFILITGTVSEEFAVEIIKAGADDYILKSSLTRLPSAIINAYTKKQAERERESNYRKLQEANKELKTFIYRASHDIRGPICSLKGLISVAKNESGDRDLVQLMDFMDNSANKLDNILMHLISTLELRDKEVLPEVIDFKAIIRDILDGYKESAKFRKLNVSVMTMPAAFTSDKKIITAILKNIIDNAIKYHNYAIMYPFINMEVTAVENGVEINVSDNGVGIKAELVEKVFDMFFRASDQTEGTGLGLYLTKIGVEKLNGTILMSSEEKSGTTVRIFIPVMKTAA